MENGAEDHQGVVEDQAPLAPGLYLAATPIGAAGDFTLRARDALRRADALAAEDTRVLRRLMEIHGAPLGGRPLIAYHDHNAASARPRLMALLEAGKSVLYASDAGTPLVADPGYRLAEAARAAGVDVIALPGPSAVLAGLLASGLPTDAFAFIGFPPPRSARRRRWIEGWAAAPGTLILFESPRRLAETLGDLAAALGDRPAAVMRELTKKFEETRRGGLETLAAAYAQEDPPRGEIVVAIAGAPKRGEVDDAAAVDNALRDRMKKESLKDAVRTVTEQMSAPRKFVYERAIALRDAETDAADES